MQIMSMSSPSMSDAADTPISGSGESSNPQSPIHESNSKHHHNILDFSTKKGSSDCDPSNGNGISEKIVESERSVNSSPATLVPTPRSTPPMNGILTPPNDVEGNNEPAKAGKPGGRLKFFKDGILCLELSHHGEGERTKWVQIRSKTVFPTLVHALKEATIPCHSTPSSFASPSSLTNANRVESSTSHSLSDDASSMLSSPRTRESHWKQPVPQRGVSACLEFYMKPAPCALKLRSKSEELSHSQDQKRKRWPYYFRRTEDIFVKLKNSVQCSCDVSSSRVLIDSSYSGNNNNNDKNSNDENLADKTSILETKLSEALRKTRKPVNRRKTLVSLQDVVGQLEKTAAVRQTTKDGTRQLRSNGEAESGRKSGYVKIPPAVTPKKRLFNEVEPKESTNVRPKKKSPNRAYDVGKTILNVPALNSEYYKRQTNSSKTSKSPGRSPPMAGADVYEFKNSRKGSDSPSQKRSNRSSPYLGAKSISPGTSTNPNSMLKPGLTAELLDRFSPVSGRNVPRISDEHHLSPRHQGLATNLQEQKYLQQQTVSKAISYTINSLLGTGSVASSSESPTNLTSKMNSQKLAKEGGMSNSHNHHHGSRHNSPVRSIPGGGRPEDQKSFLRHLLDTSDPIPPMKPADKGSKSMPRSSVVVNQNNGKSSNAKLPRGSSSNPSHLDALPLSIPKNSGSSSGSKPIASSSSSSSAASHHQPKSSAMSDVQQNLATNLALSQLMSFPLGLGGAPYDLLSRSANANPHSTEALTAAAAAAAALQQYGTLIPGNFFNPVNMNNPMAAAMAASYFGMVPMPNFPMSAATATPPPNTSQSSSTPPPPKSSSSSSSARKNIEHSSSSSPSPHHHSNHRSLLQRPGMANGHPSVSSPPSRSSSSASTATGISQNSPARPSSSAISSCEALNLSAKKKNRSEEAIDMDAPLDLCKKSSR